MKLIISTIILISGLIGGIFYGKSDVSKGYLYDNGADNVSFGAINYPTSLDSLTNPSATDSVATVSHSAQHSNANDAIEALEAKARIDGDISNGTQLFASNGTNSGWTSFASGTQAYFTNFFATGSSTLQNFAFINATGTAATTTNSFATTASSTNLYGAALITCNSNNFLQWAAGKFGCGTISASGVTNVFSTTTTAAMATTTLRGTDMSAGSFGTIIKVKLDTNGALSGNTILQLRFNADDGSTYFWTNEFNGGTADKNSTQKFVNLGSSAVSRRRKLTFEVNNVSTITKFGTYDINNMDSGVIVDEHHSGSFGWDNGTDAISTIQIGTNTGATIPIGTEITVYSFSQ